MQELLCKIAALEEDQREIELLKVEQNELKENYVNLESKYSTLEAVNPGKALDLNSKFL